MSDIQYIEQARKGATVIYKNKRYRIQDDGRGFLHIVVTGFGKRSKIGLNFLFEYGSYQDWVFNGWWHTYPDYDQFREFCENEKAIQSQ